MFVFNHNSYSFGFNYKETKIRFKLKEVLKYRLQLGAKFLLLFHLKH